MPTVKYKRVYITSNYYMLVAALTILVLQFAVLDMNFFDDFIEPLWRGLPLYILQFYIYMASLACLAFCCDILAFVFLGCKFK